MDNQQNKKEVKEPVKISKAVLTQQVEEGWKKKQLAQHYGLSELKMGEVLRNAGLRIKKLHHPKYVFVEDTQEEGKEEAGEVVIDNTVNPPVTGSSEALAQEQEEQAQESEEQTQEAPEDQKVEWK